MNELMDPMGKLIRRAQATGAKFTELRRMAKELTTENPVKDCLRMAKALSAAESYQARSPAMYLFGHLAAHSQESLKFPRTRVSRDEDWRVQEIWV